MPKDTVGDSKNTDLCIYEGCKIDNKTGTQYLTTNTDRIGTKYK